MWNVSSSVVFMCASAKKITDLLLQFLSKKVNDMVIVKMPVFKLHHDKEGYVS